MGRSGSSGSSSGSSPALALVAVACAALLALAAGAVTVVPANITDIYVGIDCIGLGKPGVTNDQLLAECDPPPFNSAAVGKAGLMIFRILY